MPKPKTPAPCADFNPKAISTMVEVKAKTTGNFFETTRREIMARGAEIDPETGRVPPPKVRWKPRKVPERKPSQNAALDAHRWGTVFGGPNAPERRCCSLIKRNGVQCRGVAVRGHARCRRHGGKNTVEKRKAMIWADYRPAVSRLAWAMIYRIVRAGRIPPDLMQHHPTFRRLLIMVMKRVRWDDPKYEHWDFRQRRHYSEQCSLLVLSYLAAWEAIAQRGDWTLWTDCVRRAAELGVDKEDAG